MAVWGWDDINGNASTGNGVNHDSEALSPNQEKQRLSYRIIGAFLSALFIGAIVYFSSVSAALLP